MKPFYKSIGPAIICIIILSCIQITNIHAQDNSNIKEPPIPVYMIYPGLEDSLKAAYEGSIQGLGSAYINAIKKYDTLQQQVQKSSAESTIHFIWLYVLVALLGIMNVVILFSTSHIRKELTQMKHLEHRQMLLTSESAAMLEQPPHTQEPLLRQEQVKIQAPERPRKPRPRKSRVKSRK